MQNKKELTGMRFGRLEIGLCVGRKNGHKTYICYCDCGNEKVLKSPDLKSGRVKSCGCLKREKVAQSNVTHNLRSHRLYSIWANMKSRCYNSNTSSYQFYGNRGIQICDDWRTDFKTFYNWAVSNGYGDNLTLDRINVNGNYAPDNCRWATDKVQANNRSCCVNVTIGDITKTLTEWCSLLKINYRTVQDRRKRGWPILEALNRPTGESKNDIL